MAAMNYRWLHHWTGEVWSIDIFIYPDIKQIQQMDLTHKHTDFRDDCTESLLYVSLYSLFPVSFVCPINKAMKTWFDIRIGRRV